MENYLVSYYLGVLLIVINSITLIFINLTKDMIKIIGVINIIGFMMIAYYFMTKEKML